MAGWQRFVPWTGVLFVILFVVGIGFLGGGDLDVNNDQEVLDWYNDSGNQTLVVIGAYIWAVTAVVFLLFMNRIRAVIADAEGNAGLFAPAVWGAALVWVACFCVGTAAIAAIPGHLAFGDLDQISNADLARFLPQVGHGAIFLVGMFPLIFGLATVAVASMRHNVFASWFNWLTLACAFVLLFTVFFFPLIALGVWAIAGSFALSKHQASAASYREQIETIGGAR